MTGDGSALGDRMKAYEAVSRAFLPRRTHCIVRVDGKAFHTYTRKMDRPYDLDFMSSMWAGASYVMDQIQGCAFAYIQSDEASFLFTDFATIKTQAPFQYNVNKLVSISASAMTYGFSLQIANWSDPTKGGGYPLFDSRAFCIPDPVEVYNYFVWRQRDCIRNSILSLGQKHFSQKQLHGLNKNQIQEKLFQEKDINWANEDPNFKNGTVILPGQQPQPAEVFTQSTFIQDLIPVRQD